MVTKVRSSLKYYVLNHFITDSSSTKSIFGALIKDLIHRKSCHVNVIIRLNFDMSRKHSIT